VQKEEIGQRVQARPCFLVAAYDWLLAQVTARHDESFDGGVEQQLVKRCVGQHDAEAVVAGATLAAIPESRDAAGEQSGGVRPRGARDRYQ